MAEKKEQYIAAYIADYSSVEVVLSHAMFLSNILRKGLILLRIADPKYTIETTEQAEQELKKIKNSITCPTYVTYCAVKGKTKEILTALPVAFNVVAVVGAVDKNATSKSPMARKNVLKDFSECKTAFLLAQKKLSDPETMKNIAFTVDYKKETKDKLLWASYFARFNGSLVHAIAPNYTDEFLKARRIANMKFLDKMFGNLNVECKKHLIEKKSHYVDVDALEYASTNHFGMLISVTTKEKDVMEYFIGVQEDRTVVNPHEMPILYLNPREDLYVLCD